MQSDQELLRALAAMAEQYLEAGGQLDHQCMSAGETAVALLVRHGLVEPRARGGVWTNAGRTLLASR